MATMLYRLGRFSFRRPWRIIGVWFLLLTAILGAGFGLGGSLQDSFVIPGTESQQALDRLDAVFPQVAGAAAEVVYRAPDGEEVTDYRDSIETMARALRTIDGINSVTTPFDEYAGNQLSDSGEMAITRVQFDEASSDVSDSTLEALTDTATTARDAGLQVEFGGQVFQNTEFGITVTEVFGVVFAGVVLLITFGSLLAAGMPLLSALLGVGIVIGGITMASAFTTISSSAPLLALMIGLAVGIDYTLFILSRHRNQLANGEAVEESAAKAVGTAGTAVLFAGVTVIIALLGLLVVGIPFLSVMGIGAAFAVLIAIGVATTLLPALLGLAGERLRPKLTSRSHRRAVAHENGGGSSMGRRWVNGVTKHPILASLAVIGLLGTLAVPALSLQLSLPDGGSEPADSTQRKAYDLVTEGFGAGYNGPLIVAVDITQTTDILGDLDDIAAQLRGLDGVEWVSQGLPDVGLDTAIIQVVPSSAPDAEATKALVQDIRDQASDIEAQFDTPIAVTGTTAVGIDISNRLSNALIPFGLIVVGLSIVLLMMVFRSVLVPLKAALGFLLSVVAAFGVTVAVFQWGWMGDLLQLEKAGPILSFMPILLMAVLFGLAMDYEVFLVSGMREEFVKTGNARTAVTRGFAHSARVVTAAALIMFFVFFAFVPEGAGMIKPIALGLAAGIAFDAFLVRMTLGPALMTLMGKAAWWMPRWLSRLLPDMDIEGERLRAHLVDSEWAAEQRGDGVTADQLVVGTGTAESGIAGSGTAGSGTAESGTAGSGTAGSDGAGSGARLQPISFSVPRGGVLLVTGTAPQRRILAATLGGRLEQVSGRAQVAGHPLESERDQVARRVAMITVSGADRSVSDPTIGGLFIERLTITLPWYRAWRALREAVIQVRRLGDVLGMEVSLSDHVQELPKHARALALAAVALAERPELVMIELAGAATPAAELETFLTRLSALAPASTTIVVTGAAAGVAGSLHSDQELVAAADATIASRSIVRLDLTASPSRIDVQEGAPA